MDRKTIFLLPPQILPIPAVKGGAIETLITSLLEENEKKHYARFVVISIYDELSMLRKYNYSTIYYIDNDKVIGNNVRHSIWAYRILCSLTFLKRKVLNNRYVSKYYKHNVITPSFFVYLCRAICKKEKVDYFVDESYSYPAKLWLLAKYVGKNNSYFHIHYVPYYSRQSRFTIPNSLTVSNYCKERWVKNDGIMGKDIVIKNGIDLSLFQKRLGLDEINRTKKQLNIADNDKIVLFCGRLLKEKGIEQLLDAFDLVDLENIKLLIAGDFPTDNCNKEDYLFNKLIKNRINNNAKIIYLGFVPNDRIYIYHNIATIQVVPSICEDAGPLVCIEAMAAGVPLIVTNSGGIPEYVGSSAIIIQKDDNLVDNLRDSIVYLTHNEEKMSELRENGLKISSLFSKEKYYKDFISIFC